jgi:hypothetical protein
MKLQSVLTRRLFLFLPYIVLKPSKQDFDALIKMCWGEARGQPIAGQKAVMQTVLNRWASNHPFFREDKGQPLHRIVGRPGQFLGYHPETLIKPTERGLLMALAERAVSDWRDGFDDSGVAVWFGRGRRKPAACAVRSVRIEAHQFWRIA